MAARRPGGASNTTCGASHGTTGWRRRRWCCSTTAQVLSRARTAGQVSLCATGKLGFASKTSSPATARGTAQHSTASYEHGVCARVVRLHGMRWCIAVPCRLAGSREPVLTTELLCGPPRSRHHTSQITACLAPRQWLQAVGASSKRLLRLALLQRHVGGCHAPAAIASPPCLRSPLGRRRRQCHVCGWHCPRGVLSVLLDNKTVLLFVWPAGRCGLHDSDACGGLGRHIGGAASACGR